MNNKEIEQLVELVYPFIIKKIKQDGYFKNITKTKNATVVSTLVDGDTNVEKEVEVIFPYDTTSFFVLNKTGEDLNFNDVVCLEYWIDLKNAVAKYKVKA